MSSSTSPSSSYSIPSHLPRDPKHPSFVSSTAINEESYKVINIHKAISIPMKETGKAMKAMKPYLLNLPRFKNVYNDPVSPTRRLVVLSSSSSSPLPPQVEEIVKGEEGWEVGEHEIERGYGDMTVEEVLRNVITDEEVEIPTSFEQVGHIAHMNLRANVLPWKYCVGKAVIDKNKNIQKVITKVGTIETEFRTFDMECIGGVDDGNYVVEVKEEGNRFKLDFKTVYWNSKLAGEHRRVVKSIVDTSSATKGAKVCADVMSGVGPFAIPLGKGGVEVLANDLNPESFKYLQINTDINKVQGMVKESNMDGREFIHSIIDNKTRVDYCIMNLPAIAVEFLDAFRSWNFDSCGRPTIYVYGFYKSSTSSSYEDLVRERCEKALGTEIEEGDEFEIHRVRDVAPKKPMICARFRLPRGVEGIERVKLEDYEQGIRKGGGGGGGEEKDSKRQKLS